MHKPWAGVLRGVTGGRGLVCRGTGTGEWGITVRGGGEQWVVIGGGLLGLIAAESGARAGHEVVLLEAAPDLGGLTAGVELHTAEGATATVDRFYHVILESDRRVRALLDQLGLADRVRWTSAPAIVASAGEQYPASALTELAALPVLRTSDRVRTAASIAASLLLPLGVARRLKAEPWLRGVAGRRATEAFWGPILRAKLGTSAPEVSADFLVATFRRLVQARLKGAGDRFGVLPGGYAPIIAALGRQARAHGVTVRTATPVRRVTATAHGVRVHTAAGDELAADRVIVTTPGPIAAAMLPELTAAERHALTGAPSLGVICGAYLVEEPPNPAYITYLVDDVGITGVIGMHALLPREATAGRALVYVPRYCAPDDPWFEFSDDELDTRLRTAVTAALPGTMQQVAACAISRARHVVPLPTPAAPRPLPVRTSLPGVYVVSGAQNTSGTANVEQTLEFAAPALTAILKESNR